MKCFYHVDLDGKAAAFCVHAWVGIKSIDVSEIAKRHGGGGHVKASGFTCKELPWFV